MKYIGEQYHMYCGLTKYLRFKKKKVHTHAHACTKSRNKNCLKRYITDFKLYLENTQVVSKRIEGLLT